MSLKYPGWLYTVLHVCNRAIESKDFNDFAQLLIGMSSVHAGTRPFGKSTSNIHH